MDPYRRPPRRHSRCWAPRRSAPRRARAPATARPPPPAPPAVRHRQPLHSLRTAPRTYPRLAPRRRAAAVRAYGTQLRSASRARRRSRTTSAAPGATSRTPACGACGRRPPYRPFSPARETTPRRWRPCGSRSRRRRRRSSLRTRWMSSGRCTRASAAQTYASSRGRSAGAAHWPRSSRRHTDVCLPCGETRTWRRSRCVAHASRRLRGPPSRGPLSTRSPHSAR
mmetsp:Transcript_8726/g.27970  ORF Transcript_8726/g.27970 Transcript_8726/m.27970 type:complete len:225 (+) Transcript_8726:209-883(+)